MLTREQLVQRRATEAVELPGGGFVTIRMLGSGDATEFLFRHKEAGEDERKRAAAACYLVGCSLVGADGVRMYTPGSEAESAEIPSGDFWAIYNRALLLNAFAKEESAAAGKG